MQEEPASGAAKRSTATHGRRQARTGGKPAPSGTVTIGGKTIRLQTRSSATGTSSSGHDRNNAGALSVEARTGHQRRAGETPPEPGCAGATRRAC